MESNRKIFALELSKNFDKDHETLSLYKLINFIRSNIKSLNKDSFLEYNIGKNLINELASKYDPIDEKLLKEIEKAIWNNIDSIKKLKKYRNTRLAHNQIEQESIPIPVEEIKTIFKLVSESLNKISSRLNHESRWSLGSDDYTQQSVYSLLDYLHRFESYRIKEIEDETKVILNN